MAITIKRLSDISEYSYDSFILKKDSNLFYSSYKYCQFLTELLGCKEDYLIAIENDEIQGVLPLMYMERDNSRIYNSLPYYGSNGGIITDSQDCYQALLSEYNLRAQDKSTISSTIVTNPLNPVCSDKYSHNYVDSRIGQITDIVRKVDSDSAYQVFALIEPSARRNVRKALREGISVEKSANRLTDLEKLHRHNMETISGTPKTEYFFNLVPEIFKEGDDFDLYTALLGDQVIAALLVFYFGKTVEYFTPAVSSEYRSVQPLAAILKVAMEEAISKGFEKWNWGGTWLTQDGVYRFKRKWGAKDYKYTYFIQLNECNILNMDRHEIISRYENFYVVPFGELTNVK